MKWTSMKTLSWFWGTSSCVCDVQGQQQVLHRVFPFLHIHGSDPTDHWNSASSNSFRPNADISRFWDQIVFSSRKDNKVGSFYGFSCVGGDQPQAMRCDVARRVGFRWILEPLARVTPIDSPRWAVENLDSIWFHLIFIWRKNHPLQSASPSNNLSTAKCSGGFIIVPVWIPNASKYFSIQILSESPTPNLRSLERSPQEI